MGSSQTRDQTHVLRTGRWILTTAPPGKFKSAHMLIRKKCTLRMVAQRLKRLSAMRETWVRSLGREDPLEKEMAPHSSTLAWKIPWTEETGRLQPMGLQRVGHDRATSLSLFLSFQNINTNGCCCCCQVASVYQWIVAIKRFSLVSNQIKIEKEKCRAGILKY